MAAKLRESDDAAEALRRERDERRAQGAAERRDGTVDLCGDDDDAAAEAEARRAARARRRPAAVRAFGGQEREGRSWRTPRKQTRRSATEARTTDCLRGRSTSSWTAGEAERAANLAAEAASTGDCDGAGRLAGAARDAVSCKQGPQHRGAGRTGRRVGFCKFQEDISSTVARALAACKTLGKPLFMITLLSGRSEPASRQRGRVSIL